MQRQCVHSTSSSDASDGGARVACGRGDDAGSKPSPLRSSVPSGPQVATAGLGVVVAGAPVVGVPASGGGAVANTFGAGVTTSGGEVVAGTFGIAAAVGSGELFAERPEFTAAAGVAQLAADMRRLAV